MMTRQEYLESDSPRTEAHRRYYAQFVTERIKTLVIGWFGRTAIVTSDDPHFNDLKLTRWDALASSLPSSVSTELRERGDFLTLAGAVCILKEAAEQIRETSAGKGT
jgi:hypothetical protein